MNKQVLQSINELREELKGEVHATRAVQIVVKLSAYWAMVNEELVKAKMRYNELLNNLMTKDYPGKDISVAKAKVVAQATEIHQNLLEAESLSRSTLELIRSLKYLIKMKESERRESIYN